MRWVLSFLRFEKVTRPEWTTRVELKGVGSQSLLRWWNPSLVDPPGRHPCRPPSALRCCASVTSGPLRQLFKETQLNGWVFCFLPLPKTAAQFGRVAGRPRTSPSTPPTFSKKPELTLRLFSFVLFRASRLLDKGYEALPSPHAQSSPWRTPGSSGFLLSLKSKTLDTGVRRHDRAGGSRIRLELDLLRTCGCK